MNAGTLAVLVVCGMVALIVVVVTVGLRDDHQIPMRKRVKAGTDKPSP